MLASFYSPATVWWNVAAVVAVFGLFACKPKSPCRPDDYSVQVLVHPGNPLSMDPEDETRSLSVNVHMFQLANRDPLPRLDLDAVRADPKAALGEAYVADEKFTVWPATDDLIVFRPKPQTAHILLVAEFRKIVGVGWFLVYDLPARDDHAAAVCTAAKRKKPPIANPCFYAMFERYEMRGGGGDPPAGMPDEIRIKGKIVECAPGHYDIDPKLRKQVQRQKRRQLRAPGLPSLPLPGLPRAPTAPTPSVPSASPPATAPTVPR